MSEIDSNYKTTSSFRILFLPCMDNENGLILRGYKAILINLHHTTFIRAKLSIIFHLNK